MDDSTVISAEQFARQNSIWYGLAPALENFTRWVNRNSNVYVPPVLTRGNPERNALVAEAAFASFVLNMAPTGLAEEEARTRIMKLPRGEAAAQPLSALESFEASELRDRLREFLTMFELVPVLAYPNFPGCGIVEKATGDLLSGDCLIEVKSVVRPFRGIDFRQVLTYAALDYTDTRAIREIVLVNPRLGAYFRTDIDDLALDVGAASWVELAQELVFVMSGMVTSP